MNNDFLKRLYWACSSEESCFEAGSSLCELYERIPDVKRAGKGYRDCLAAIESKEKGKLDNFVYSLSDVREMQGFINGFRLGMKLAGELSEEDQG